MNDANEQYFTERLMFLKRREKNFKVRRNYC